MSPSRIMIVDDEPANLDFLQDTLSHSGYQLSVFPSGELALRATENQIPDLVLLDILMDGMNGYEVCRRFKSNEELRDIPIIFLSALSGTDDIVKGFEHGAVDYVTKPFHKREVMARVQTHLALHEANRRTREAARLLEQKDQLRDQLVHMIVHDMRAPLQMIIGYLDLLQDSQSEWTSDQMDYIGRALSGVRLLHGMAMDLLHADRIDEGSVSLHIEKASAREMIDLTIDSYIVPEDRVRIDLEVQEGLSLDCDRNLVVRIFANLLINALKYSNSSERVSIRAFEMDGMFEFHVADRGPGIPEELQDKVFEKYSVVLHQDIDSSKSIGIGLCFCRLATEAHGGEIGVRSRDGEGSVFFVRLPV